MEDEIYFHKNINPNTTRNNRDKLKMDRATIVQVIDGLWVENGITTRGLTLGIEFDRFGRRSMITYDNKDQISKLMKELEATQPEDLYGKRIIGYLRDIYCVGISRFKEIDCSGVFIF